MFFKKQELKDFEDLDSITFDKSQHKEHEENLNLKISSILSVFEKLNLTLEMYDENFFEYYEKMRNNLINILNEIVDNYQYIKPDNVNKEKNLKAQVDRLKREKKILKAKIESLQNPEKQEIFEIPNSYKNVKTSENQIPQVPQKPPKSINYKIPKQEVQTGNSLLKWKSKDFNKPLYNLSLKKLSYNQTLDLIQEIYKSKKEFNEKCKQQLKPVETMEQFTYNFLKQKYGLNNMVIEQFFALIVAIKNYSQKDPEIGLFGFILQNQIDEEFQEIIHQIKMTLKDLVLGLLEEDYPQKSKNFLYELLEEKTNGNLEFHYAEKIVNLMYADENPKKKEILDNLNAEIINEKNSKIQNSIKYKFLEQIILKSQIQTHRDYLQNLRNLFIQFDDQKLGYINRENFLKLLQKIDDQKNLDSENVLKKMDPFNTDIITFSQTVTEFTRIQISLDQSEEKVNLLQLVYSL